MARLEGNIFEIVDPQRKCFVLLFESYYSKTLDADDSELIM